MEYVILVFLLAANAVTIRYLILLRRHENYEDRFFKMQMKEIEVNKAHEEVTAKQVKLDDALANVKEPYPESAVVFSQVERKEFKDSINAISGENKKMYENIIEYVKTLQDVIVVRRKYYECINYKKGKIIAQLAVRNGRVVVKTNIGKIKTKKGMDPMVLKPIKIALTDEQAMNKAKSLINVSYLRISGQIALNIKEGAE